MYDSRAVFRQTGSRERRAASTHVTEYINVHSKIPVNQTSNQTGLFPEQRVSLQSVTHEA